MKTIKTTLAIVALTFLSISCNKDDSQTVVFPEENFLQGLISNGGFNTPTTFNGNKDLLYVFTPKVKGKINSLVVKIPVTSSVEVRIWDLTNSSLLLFQEIFAIPIGNVDFIKSINSIELNKDSRYLISMNCQSHFKYQRTSTLAPINSGNITINHFGEYDGRLFTLSDYNSGFNSISIGNSVDGNISFNFQQTE